MAQHIYWEYHFALVYFDCYSEKEPNHEYLVGGEQRSSWCPQKDFQSHLEQLAIPKNYFESDDEQIFPPGFNDCWIRDFERARIDLLNYIRIEELGETWIREICSGCGAQGEDNFSWNEDEDTYSCLRCGHPLEEGEVPEGACKTFRISISVEESNPPYMSPFDMGRGQRDSPTIESSGLDPLYLLYDWLFTVNPKGRYGTDRWVVLGHGVDSDDRVVTSIDTFLKHNGEHVVARRNLYFDAYPEIDARRGYALNEQMVHYYSPSAIRDMIKAWHPVLFAG